MNARRLASQHAHARRDQPAITSDGRRITVLANVATPAELDVGLRYGAEGIGLLRTELAFLDALDWPTEQQHTDVLQPILSGADGRPAVVRVLDFGADKSPPFLRGVGERGLALLLRYPDAFVCQLRALLLCSHDRDVRILLPMVERPEQIVATRALLEHAAEQLGVVAIPPLGAMIETPGAAENAPAIAEQTNFLSIGTNDLTAAMLGADRFAENAARAYDPRVLRSIARSVSAAHAAAIAIEVCGEAASDPVMLPLLVGLGVDEVSVGAARVGEVRQWIRELVASSAERVAGAALEMGTADQVAAAARPLSGGVHALSV
jgi:phosphoenolpyruvate-protein kinase (PTS system EI component)